jgi:hypothetical protein
VLVLVASVKLARLAYWCHAQLWQDAQQEIEMLKRQLAHIQRVNKAKNAKEPQ